MPEDSIDTMILLSATAICIANAAVNLVWAMADTPGTESVTVLEGGWLEAHRISWRTTIRGICETGPSASRKGKHKTTSPDR